MTVGLRIALALALLAGCAPDARVPTGAHLIKTAGDGQLALTGQSLPIGPSVLITNDTDDPVAGVPVGCEVVTGEGSISLDVTYSGDSGVANCGAWSLGHRKGLNQLRVYANGLDPVVFSAIALDSSSSFPIFIQEPAVAFTGPSLDLIIETDSPHNVTSVTASFAGHSNTLTLFSFDGTRALFGGTLDLEGVETGTLDALIVRATDDHFGVAETGALLTFDLPPELVVSSPTEQLGFSRPQVQLSAIASGNGDVEITARSHGQLLAHGTNALLATVDLSAFDHQLDEIDFTATDSIGVGTSVARSVWVSSNQNVRLAAAVSGTVLDFDGTRALHASDGGLLIADFSQQADIPVAPDFGASALGPDGAVICTHDPIDSGTLVVEGLVSFVPTGCSQFEVEGHYLAVTDDHRFPFLADLNEGTLLPMFASVIPDFISLAPTGDAVFNDQAYQVVHSSADGGWEVLPLDSNDGSYRINPVTDGHLVAYDICSGADCNQLGVWDGLQEHRLSFPTRVELPMLNQGWLAWLQVDGPDSVELWVDHWPDPPVRAAPGLHALDPIALLPGGTLVVASGTQLFRVPVGAPPEPFFTRNSAFGTVVQRNGHAYYLFHGLAVEVLP